MQRYLLFSLLILCAFQIPGCAYNQTTNNYTITGDGNKLDTDQTSSTSKPVDVQTDVAGSGYGSVATKGE